MKQYVVIGNGVAGTTAAEYIRKNDEQGNITIITDEDLPFYYRIRLNELISGDIQEGDLVAKADAWYRERKIDLKLETRVAGGSADEKFVVTDRQEKFPYDALLVATGSHSFVPPIAGSEKKGVFALRGIQDARDIFWALKPATPWQSWERR